MCNINLWRPFCGLWCAVFLLTAVSQAADGSSNNAVRVVIDLRDGSRINGSVFPPDLSFELKTTEIGTVEVPLDQIARVDFAKNGGTAIYHLQNGDKLKGVVQLSQFDLQTLLGTLTIPISTLSTLKVEGLVAGASKIIVLKRNDWKALPFPLNTDWSGDQGVLSTIDNHGIHLNGQPVRSVNPYKLPLEIDCDFTLAEPLLHGGGELVFNLGVPGAPDTMLSTHMLQLDVTTLTDMNQGKLLTAQYTGDIAAGVILDQPPCENVQVGVLNHIKINMTVDGWTVQLNNAPAVTEDFTAESNEVQIDLWNFQPDSRWTVSKFTIIQPAP